ncbi:MAG: hypothetical protein ABR958_06000 [Dehalococcoidales bacterium]|jgi:hypothetical protein
MVVHGERVSNKQTIPSETRRFFISIAGTRCAIFSHDAGFLDLLRERYRSFESPGPAAYEILVKLVPVEKIASGKTVRPSHPLIKRVNSGENYIIKEADKYVAVANTCSMKVLVKMGKSVDCFDGFLRMLFILIMANEKGLLLDASAVVENGRCFVFFGPSRSGTSTVVPSTASAKPLGNEMVIIKPHNGGYRVYGTPFRSESVTERSNARAELGALYYTKRNYENSLMRLDKEQALANLYQYVPIFNGDSQVQGRILDACRALADNAPVYELHCLSEASLWQVINGTGRRDLQVQPGRYLQATT